MMDSIEFERLTGISQVRLRQARFHKNPRDLVFQLLQKHKVIPDRLVKAAHDYRFEVLGVSGFQAEKYLPFIYRHCPYDFIVGRKQTKHLILEYHNLFVFSIEESLEEMEDTSIDGQYTVIRINPPDHSPLFSSVNCSNLELAVQLAILIIDRGKFTQITIKD